MTGAREYVTNECRIQQTRYVIETRVPMCPVAALIGSGDEYYKILPVEWRGTGFNYDIMRAGRVARVKERNSRVTRPATPPSFIAESFQFVQVAQESFLPAEFTPDDDERVQGTRENGKFVQKKKKERVVKDTRSFQFRLLQAFDHADADTAGSLTKRQYKIAMTAVFGYLPDKVEVKQVFRATDRISYDEFERWVLKKCVVSDSKINAEIIFALLDKDYKGYLILDDFYSASEFVDLKVPSSVWQTVFKDLDRYKRGYIELNELLCVLPAV